MVLSSTLSPPFSAQVIGAVLSRALGVPWIALVGYPTLSAPFVAIWAPLERRVTAWTSGRKLLAHGAAVVGLAAFVWWELRTDHPLLDPRFFRHRDFTMGSFAITATFFGIFGMFFVLTQFLQFVQGHDALATGVRILPYGLLLLVVAPMAAGLVERLGAALVRGLAALGGLRQAVDAAGSLGPAQPRG